MNCRAFPLFAVLALVLASCVDDAKPEPTAPSARLGLDETISCPEGEVGWRFATKPLDKTSEAYAQRSGDDSVVEITKRFAVEPQSATCDGSAFDTTQLRNECGGDLTCRYSPACAGAFSVTYTCGAADKNADGTQRTYSAAKDGSGVVTLQCSQPAQEAVEVETRTACVPRQCHGRARRNLDMQCVENPDALDVVMKGGFDAWYKSGFDGRVFIEDRYPIRDVYDVFADRATYGAYSGFNAEPIFPTSELYIELWAEFWFGLIPEDSNIVAWMSDTYKNRSTGVSVEAFRCVAFKREIETDTPNTIGDDVMIPMSYVGKISEDCQQGGRVSEDSAAKKLGLSVDQFRQQYAYHSSKLRGSYDMEGNAVWHKVAKFRSFFPIEDLAYHEPECAPNPQEFYYDASTGTYDLLSYYAQREYAEPRELHFVEPSVPRQAHLIPGEVEAGNLTIRTTSRLNTSIPVDFSWRTVNLTKENPFNPFAEGVDIGGAWNGGSLPGANYGPRNLKASFYAYPLGQTNNTSRYYAYKLGEIPLQSRNPEGNTQSANLPINESVKRYFTQSSSQNYISGDTRLYTLFYCIESDDNPNHAGDAFKVKTGTEYYFPSNGADFATRPYETNFVMREPLTDPARPAYALVLDTDRDARNAGFRRGCRKMSKPFRVTLDRFTTPLEPISASGFTGSTNNESTGDSKMSGENDNDSEVNCMGQSRENCVETVNSGNRTDGESGRSTYDLNNRLARNPGDEAGTSMTAEMVGFQLIDPMDPESSSVGFPADASSASSNPITISLAPDWDGIKTALERASTGSATEWETGPYGGQMGLGVGWGFKWKFFIGPVPVIVSFTFTVGASVKIEAQFQFRPTPEQAYPCIGTETCAIRVAEAKTFRDAARDCNVRGGRLGELSSQAEADAVDAARAGQEIWLGGQLAYRHDKPSCATNFVASECLAKSRTEYRWMSNSVAFASNNSNAAPDYTPGAIYNAAQAGLATSYPNPRAITYEANGALGTAGTNEGRQYVCVYEPTFRERFFRWQLGLSMGAAAGFTLKGCTPYENPGFCLQASFNVVSFNIGPVFENVYHWLIRANEDESWGRRGNTNISVPWALKLFEGGVSAAVNFLWFTISWNLLTYDGITAAEGKLYDADTPVHESYR